MTEEWSFGARGETAFSLQLPRKYTAAPRLLGSTSDLLALRANGTLLHRVPEPADGQKARAISGNQHHDGTHAPIRLARRHAPKSGGGRALGRPALPLQPGARPNGAPPAPPHPPHSLASTHPTHVLTPQLTEKRNPASWTPVVPIRQTAPTTRTPFVHPSTAPPPANPVVVRSVPRSIAYTKHEIPHSRERAFLQQPEISKVANPTREQLETVRQN